MVNAQQIELLDNLHTFLRSGSSTADFLAFTGLSAEQSAEQSDEVAALEPAGQIPMEQVGAIALLVEAIAQRLSAASPADPLANLQALEQAAQNGWLLSTPTSPVALLWLMEFQLSRLENRRISQKSAPESPSLA